MKRFFFYIPFFFESNLTTKKKTGNWIKISSKHLSTLYIYKYEYIIWNKIGWTQNIIIIFIKMNEWIARIWHDSYIFYNLILGSLYPIFSQMKVVVKVLPSFYISYFSFMKGPKTPNNIKSLIISCFANWTWYLFFIYFLNTKTTFQKIKVKHL